MKIKYLIVSIIVYALSINFGYSQSRFSKQQLESDLVTLYSFINDVHPDMFAVMPKEKFEKEFERIKTNLKDSMTDFDFFVQVAPLIHDLQDGHTTLRPPYTFFPPFENDILLEAFPFKLSINPKDTSLIVSEDFSGIKPIIPKGSRILKINNFTDKDLITKIIKYTSGEKFTFRTLVLNDYFPILIPVLLPVLCQKSEFKINYIVGGKSHSKTVKTVLANTIKEKFIPDEYKAAFGYTSDYTFETKKELNTVIIRFDSFDLNDYLPVFLDSTFRYIKENNIQNLIIDLRYNGGGNSRVGDEFFQYISPVPFEQFGKTYVKISDVIKEWMPDEYGNKETSTIFLEKSEELTPLRENPLRYNGRTFLLTSVYTFSSATDFAWAFQYFKMGTVIGEETGGLVVCFGDMMSYRLPNTKIHFGASYKKFYGYGATDENTHGVIPDIEIPAEQALEKAFELIRNKK